MEIYYFSSISLEIYYPYFSSMSLIIYCSYFSFKILELYNFSSLGLEIS